MMIESSSIEKIKQLRKLTGVSAVDCFEALKKCNHNYDEALKWIKENIVSLISTENFKTSEHNGVSLYYNHGNMAYGVVVTCASDSVSRNDEFMYFAKNICIQKLTFEEASSEAHNLSLRFGEKIVIAQINKQESKENEQIVVYNHHNLRAATCLIYEYKVNKKDIRGRKIEKNFPFNEEIVYNSLDIKAQSILFHVAFIADRNLTVETLMTQKYFNEEDAKPISLLASDINITYVSTLVLPKATNEAI